jgi:hypothetical protein
MQELRAQKLLIFYFTTQLMWHPTSILEKHPRFNLLPKKKHFRKHIIGEWLAIKY